MRFNHSKLYKGGDHCCKSQDCTLWSIPSTHILWTGYLYRLGKQRKLLPALLLLVNPCSLLPVASDWFLVNPCSLLPVASDWLYNISCPPLHHSEVRILSVFLSLLMNSLCFSFSVFYVFFSVFESFLCSLFFYLIPIVYASAPKTLRKTQWWSSWHDVVEFDQ